MAITPEHAGRSYPPTPPYQVSRAKIAEFAAALGDENPAYRHAAGGDGEPLAPPTFAVVVAGAAWGSLFGDPELELALERIMHTEQGFRWERPLRAGDEVTAALTVEKVRNRGTTDLIATSIRIGTTDGELVCTATASFLHSRGAAA